MAKKRSKSITQAEQAKLEAIHKRWLTDEQTAQYSDDAIVSTARDVLSLTGKHDNVPVYVVGSVHEARTLAGSLELLAKQGTTSIVCVGANIGFSDSIPSVRMWFYSCLFWNPYAAWYEGGKVLGVKYDEDKYELFQRVCKHTPVWLWSSRAVFILRRPKSMCWNNNRRSAELHNTTGPSVYFDDSLQLWHIDGIPVDEQIVMAPETQTIEQINSEDNNDRRAIRIERYGWDRYLHETNATLLDSRHNEIEGTQEALYATDGTNKLCASCPTGRFVALSVPSDVTTCEQAQEWLAGNNPFHVLART